MWPIAGTQNTRRFVVSSGEIIENSENLHGQGGYIRIHNTDCISNLFHRSVTCTYPIYKNGKFKGETIALNRGSLIDFLRANGSDSLSKGFLGFIGGVSDQDLTEAFASFVQRDQEDKSSLEERAKKREGKEEEGKIADEPREERKEQQAEKRKRFSLSTKGEEKIWFWHLPSDKKKPSQAEGATKKLKYAEMGPDRDSATTVARLVGTQREAAERIQKEAEILEELQNGHCPAVVPYFGTKGAESKKRQIKQYLYLALYQGDLTRFFLKIRDLPDAQKRKIALQLLSGLARMHELGISHNDIKPQNILIRLDGDEPEVVFCDFELAFSDRDFAKAKSARADLKLGGTVRWLSPERCAILCNSSQTNPLVQLTKMDETRKPADVWSLGLVFLTLLSKNEDLSWFKPQMELVKMLSHVAKFEKEKGSFYQEPAEKNSLEHIIWEMLQYDYRTRLTAEEALRKVEGLPAL